MTSWPQVEDHVEQLRKYQSTRVSAVSTSRQQRLTMFRQTSSDSWSLGEDTAGDEMVRTVVYVRCSAAGSLHCVVALS